MFTEIKQLINSKRILKKEYKSNLNMCKNNNKKYAMDKYAHSYDCLSILKKVKGLKYFIYAPSVLLHDIGRFSEYKNTKEFDHAECGYELLKKIFTDNTIILLPIKYHEKDLSWYQEIKNNIDFKLCSDNEKKIIIECCSLVRDIDIISNMKMIINENIIFAKRKRFNKTLIKLLCNKQIGEKNMIISEYDKFIYILCGLSLIKFKESFKYIKKHKLIQKLVIKMRNSDINNIKLQQEIDMIEKTIVEMYNL